MTSEGTVLFGERQEKLCTVRVTSVVEPMNAEQVEPELTWSGVSTLLSVFRVLPYRTSSGARFRGLKPCSFSPALHTDRSFSVGLACTLTLSHLPHRINLSSVQTVSSDALARTARTLLLPQAGTAGVPARLDVAL